MDAGVELDGALAEARDVMRAWDVANTDWSLAGALPGASGTVMRPVITLGGEQYVLRRLPDDLRDEAARFRHDFARHLRVAQIPVPDLLATATGRTWVSARGGRYEAQAWLPGEPFLSASPHSGAWLAAAGEMLGELHQASADYTGRPLSMPDERSVGMIARASIELLAQTADRGELTPQMAQTLHEIADACRAGIEGLTALADAPAIHIHGDYQPHHLAFDATRVVAVYDLDATHLAPRVVELAYAVLTFTGLDWGDQPGWTPPLAPDGLDVLRVRRFLGAYGAVAPPAPGEAALLVEAIGVVLPIVLANAALEDIVFPNDFGGEPDEDDMRARLYWATSLWLWLDRYRDMLAQAWEGA
ncbi:MAG TPA: phosphotransferase [Ktedonobacterales bacterium]